MRGFLLFSNMKQLHAIRWDIQPLTRLAIYFSLGCLCSKYFSYSLLSILISTFCWLLLFFYVTYTYFKAPSLKKPSNFSHRGILIGFIFFLSGLINGVISNPLILDSKKLDSIIGNNTFLLIQIDSEPRLKSGVLSLDCQILQVFLNGDFHPINYKVRVQIKNGDPALFQFAQRKLISGKLTYPNPSLLPGEFDYSKFLLSKGIVATVKIDKTQVVHVSQNAFSFQRLAFTWRSSILKRFHNDVLKSDEKQVASALLLGDRTEINSELLKEYSSGGIIHILAVSGLHVGLIYQLFILIFKYFKFLQKNRLDMLLIILFLWIYAAMTGLSPSVNRAVCMFTLLSVADFLNRNVSPFNILSSAAFLLLLVNPSSIYDMGFQLSFAAVWGILSTRPILDRLQTLPKNFAKFVLTPIVISIAAQIATLPFSLYSFGTFPTWFLPANIIAVPLSTLLTYLGIVSLMFADIPYLGWGLMSLFSLGLKALNFWAGFISELPYAQISNLKIGLIEFICFTIAVFLFFSFFKKRNSKYVLLFLTCILFAITVGFLFSKSKSDFKKPLVFCHKNAIHIHTYSDIVDHHFIILTNNKKSKIQEIQKLINPIYIKNKKMVIHPLLVNKYPNIKHKDASVFLADTLGRNIKSFKIYSSSEKKTAVVVFWNDDTIRFIENNKSFLNMCIPVPWMGYMQKKLLSDLTSKLDISFFDPEKSGWSYL